MAKCSFELCGKTIKSRGLCDGHYRQILRGEKLRTLRTASLGTLEERVFTRTDRSGDCWVWTGGLDHYGYGSIRFGGKTLKTHRVAYESAFGAIPPGLVIDHKCHTRSCIRPDHLQAVTQKQNQENVRNDARGGMRGVTRSRRAKKWTAQVSHNGRKIYVGSFPTIAEANDAAVSKRMELFENNLDDRRDRVASR